jgi:molybdenum cofactor biosynthesis enzyme MoaA
MLDQDGVAKPDVVCSNLAGNHVTNLIKQYAEFGLPYPIVGFNLNTADAWAAGDGNLSGTWPMVWYHTSDVPASKTFVENCIKFRLNRNGALVSCLTRFLHANRYPLRWKTLHEKGAMTHTHHAAGCLGTRRSP